MDQAIYLLTFQGDRYVPKTDIKIELGFAIALNFSEDSSKLLITTNKRALLILDPLSYRLLTSIDEMIKVYWN